MDDSLKDLFDNYKPDMGDSSKYMAMLEKKIELTEYVMKEKRRSELHIAKAFVIGTIVGALAVLFFQTYPIYFQLSDIWSWIVTNLNVICAVGIGVLLTFAHFEV